MASMMKENANTIAILETRINKVTLVTIANDRPTANLILSVAFIPERQLDSVVPHYSAQLLTDLSQMLSIPTQTNIRMSCIVSRASHRATITRIQLIKAMCIINLILSSTTYQSKIMLVIKPLRRYRIPGMMINRISYTLVRQPMVCIQITSKITITTMLAITQSTLILSIQGTMIIILSRSMLSTIFKGHTIQLLQESKVLTMKMRALALVPGSVLVSQLLLELFACYVSVIECYGRSPQEIWV